MDTSDFIQKHNASQKLDLSKLNYTFKDKPLLVGGMAKEAYEVRKSGKDIDLIVSEVDYIALSKLYQNNLRDLFGDLGVVVYDFEIWKTIASYGYTFLSENAFELDNYKLVTLENLLFMTSLATSKEKYKLDFDLIIKRIFDLRYNRN